MLKNVPGLLLCFLLLLCCLVALPSVSVFSLPFSCALLQDEWDVKAWLRIQIK